MNGLVPAGFAANRPRRPDIPILGADLIVFPFAEGRADRMNGRQVEHVESHLRDARQLTLDVVQRAGRAREHLVPGTELRALAVDLDHHLDRVARRKSPLGVAPHQVEQIEAPHLLDLLFDRIVALERVDERSQLALVARAGSLMRGADQLQSDGELHVEVGLPRVSALLQIAMPRQEAIDPRFDRVEVEAELLGGEVGAPSIVDEWRHPHLAHFLLRRVAELQDRRDLIVPVGEDVGFDDHAVASDPLRRKEAAIDLGLHPFDDDAAAAVELCHGRRERVRVACPAARESNE